MFYTLVKSAAAKGTDKGHHMGPDKLSISPSIPSPIVAAVDALEGAYEQGISRRVGANLSARRATD